jgi:ribonuclease VapC
VVIDSSAIVAIFLREPEREEFMTSILADARPLISAPTLVETKMVLRRVLDDDGLLEVAEFLTLFEIEVVAFDHAQSLVASEAFDRYGKGRHVARLNFGDCFSYALAKHTGEPLLFKGNDFGATDLRIA